MGEREHESVCEKKDILHACTKLDMYANCMTGGLLCFH